MDNGISYSELKDAIVRIEDEISDKLQKQLSGYFVFVNVPPFKQENVLNTSVEDVREVCFGGLRIACLMRDDTGHALNNMIFRMREIKKGETRGKLRFIPNGAFAVDWYLLIPSAFDKSAYVGTFYFVQKEQSYIPLLCDKRFAIHPSKMSDDASKMLQNAINRLVGMCFDNKNSFGVVYEYKDILFAFPMEAETLKLTFKKREKKNGRRRVLPVVVKEHVRNGSIIPRHLRVGEKQIEIDGRIFTFLFGSDFAENAFSNKNGNKRICKMAKNDELTPIIASTF